MDSTLRSRITGAEQTATREESPIAALFRKAGQLQPDPPPSEGSPPAPAVPRPVFGSSRFMDLPVDLLEEMQQPFRLYSEKRMEDMTEDIRQRGIIQRLIVRPNPEQPGRYQIIAGRHRRRGAMGAGYALVPCEIRELDDTEARLQMISSNLKQRDELLPSEKAWAYREQMELMAHQGKRADIEKYENGLEPLGENEKLTSRQSVGKLETADAIAEDESGRQVQRYIRLTYLLPELLEAVDAGSLGFGVGVTLSYLSGENQEAVYDYFFVTNKITISGVIADTLRASDEKGVTLTADRLAVILAPPVPLKRFNKVSVPMKQLRSYFPPEATKKQVEKQIVEIVTAYFRGGGQ